MGIFLEELRRGFAENAGRTAIDRGGERIPYSVLEADVDRRAGWLQRQGIEPGERVLLAVENKLDFVRSHLAVLFAGGVSAPVHPRLAAEELAWILDHCEPRVAIADGEARSRIEGLACSRRSLVVASPGALDGGPPARAASVDESTPCLLIYSSGTTGRPKGVLHAQGNLSSSLAGLAAAWQISDQDRFVHALPLFHIHGLSFGLHLALRAGAATLLQETFHPQRTLESIGGGTVLLAVPTFYHAFLDRPDFPRIAKSWTDVRLLTCGSAPIRPEVLGRLEEIVGRPIIHRYGMTEAHVIASLPLEGPWPAGSVGAAIEGIEFRLSGPAEAASIHVRGPNLFREYWRDPVATKAAFVDGWFDTGDLGRCGEDGFLWLVGRKSELIITSGFNVYPAAVERVLHQCPGVREAAVFGAPDARRGERVVAAVVRSDPAIDSAKIRRFLAERLVEYQRPALIHFVDALPRNAMGKVQRNVLRDAYSGESGGWSPVDDSSD